MKMRVKVKSYTTKEIDVEFPLYLKGGDVFDSGGWYETYRRIDENGMEYTIQINNHDEWEFKKEHNEDLKGALGYLLVESSDHHKMEAKEFYDALARMKAQMEEVPPCE